MGACIMKIYKDLSQAQIDAKNIIDDGSLTYEQTVSRLAKLAENLLPYPEGTHETIFELAQKGMLCDLEEGHAPFAPRYILPDYEKLLKEGCSFLRLEPANTLAQTIHSLLIFYRHVPSVTRQPVYIGGIDKLLDPFIVDEAVAKEMIRFFLIHIDRTITDSFCHANIGPEETLAGRIITELLKELKNVTPNMTLLYDREKTSDAFALKCVEASLICANPAFANDPVFQSEFKDGYGIASCYNGLPQRGGAFTLSRLRLNKIAENSVSMEDFFKDKLPLAIDAMLAFMEAKIRFLAEKTPFFKSNFLVLENFIDIDRFTGLFGLVGMHECVSYLLKLQGMKQVYGTHKEADLLGVRIVEAVNERVGRFKSSYCKISNNRFLLHAQVGAGGDHDTSPGMRIAIGCEPHIHQHIKQAGLFHKYFPSGIGDHFPFDHTAQNNPKAVLDIFKGAFASGMRYISAYPHDGDLIRVTGYLIKKSDLKNYTAGSQVSYDTVQYAKDAIENYGVLKRKVRTTFE